MNIPTNWDSESWLEQLNESKSKEERDLLNKLVFENTVKIISEGCYCSYSGKKVSMNLSNDILSRSKIYQNRIDIANSDNIYSSPNIYVVEMDCLECAHQIQIDNNEVCVLNNASPHYPGGSVIYGPGAQEEYLCKCSNYYQGLFQYGINDEIYKKYVCQMAGQRYPLDMNYGGCYVPEVTVFRGTAEQGYRLIDRPWKTNIIAVPALYSPDIYMDVQGKGRLRERDKVITLNKIRTIFNIARINNQRNLVLTAWGCGAYLNPPEEIAILFRTVLIEEGYAKFFKKISFSIINTNENYRIFHSILHGL